MSRTATRNRSTPAAAPVVDAATVARLTAALEASTAALQKANEIRSVPPVTRSGTISSDDFKVGQDSDVTLSSTGDAKLDRPANEPVEIEVARGMVPKEQLDNLKFMNEMVTVMVLKSNDKHAEPFVEIRNSGILQMFPRGEKVTCRRVFLEGLARAKPTSFENVEYLDGAGNRAVKYPRTTAVKYPFQVIRDDNPIGEAWLEKVLAEA